MFKASTHTKCIHCEAECRGSDKKVLMWTKLHYKSAHPDKPLKLIDPVIAHHGLASKRSTIRTKDDMAEFNKVSKKIDAFLELERVKV